MQVDRTAAVVTNKVDVQVSWSHRYEETGSTHKISLVVDTWRQNCGRLMRNEGSCNLEEKSGIKL